VIRRPALIVVQLGTSVTAARAEESRKQKEAAVAKVRSIQDKLDAARKARQQRFSPDMASSTTATASSGTGPSSTSRVPVSTGPAPGSQGGSDTEMRGPMRAPTPGLVSQPQSGNVDDRSDIVSMYSEDGKPFSLRLVTTPQKELRIIFVLHLAHAVLVS
jgi:hypothetical protein